ncbi:ankyrin repeat domain-containing protein [Tamlana agarivorans]|uniref:Ankyrin repeat domain-containing protein n=1 Tax=Pseudotamlana agarivorans TaxID=481183 RepID=A0ACC5UB72_9FLAO|nr:ankyrin repeat domain-containing protein [Tamlana agarivorans]MBU2951583.1 ankyrin repeat domain-containing protein [Tamlana agarivorans]
MNIYEPTEFNEREISNSVYLAYFYNEFTQLEALIEKGLDINHEKVHETIKYAEFKIEAMEKFVSLGFNVNVKSGLGGLPKFFDFVEGLQGDQVLLKRVLNIKGINFNELSKRGSNILSVFNRTLELLSLEQADDFSFVFIKLIIEKGFNYTFIDKRGNSILHYIEKSPKALAFLVEKGLDINSVNTKGITSLMHFCLEASNNEAYVEAVKKYIKLGADIHISVNNEESTKHGWTALHHAIYGRVPLIAKYLLSIGAKYDQVFKDGTTTLDLTIKTNNKEVISLFMDAIETNKTPTVIKSMIAFFLVNMNYSEIITWFEELPLEEANWETLHTASVAYRKIGAIKTATKYGLLGIKKFGINNYLLDNIVFIYVVSGEFQKALEIWNQFKNEFIPTNDPAANTIGHVVVAYDKLNKHKEGFEDVFEFVEKAKSTRETKAGFMFFNVACLASINNDIDNTINLSALALSKAYKASDFNDCNFDTIRNTNIFKTLMDFSNNKVLYLTFKKEDEIVTFYSRCNNEYDFIIENDKVRSVETRSFNDLGHMLRMVYSEIGYLKQDGYKPFDVDFINIWIPVYDDLFKRILATTKDPLGRLNMEWDFDHNDNTLTRPYYVYCDNGYELDHYNEIYYIPTQKIYESVISKVVKLDAFKALNKKDTVEIIQSEHDGGKEFTFTYV